MFLFIGVLICAGATYLIVLLVAAIKSEIEDMKED